MWLAVLPISFTLAQTDRTIVKNDEVQGSMNSMSAGEILPTDTREIFTIIYWAVPVTHQILACW